MIKRLVLILALGAAFAACSGSGTSTSGSPNVIEPTPVVQGSAIPSDAVPSMSAGASTTA